MLSSVSLGMVWGSMNPRSARLDAARLDEMWVVGCGEGLGFSDLSD